MRAKFFVVLVGILLSSPQTFAAPSGLTVQGRLVHNDIPVTGAVNMTVSVTSPNSDLCYLFEETHSLTLSSTAGGVFSVQIGSGTRSANDKGFSLVNVFSNTGSSITGLTCTGSGVSSYTPLSGHSRYIYISFDTSLGPVAFADPYVVQSVPYAFESEKLSGKTASQYLQTTTATTQSKLNDLMVPATYTELLSLLSGTSTRYMTYSTSSPTKLPVLSAAPTTPSAGQIWYEAGSLKYYDGVSTSVKTLGTSSGSVSNIATGAGLTGGPITGTGTIALESDVIATTGTYNSVTVDTYGRVTAGTNPTTLTDYGITDAVKSGGQAGSLTLGTSDATSLTLNTNNTAKMTILSSGSVGVGTTSPTALLDVDVNAATKAGLRVTTGGTEIGTIGNSSNSGYLFLRDNSGGGLAYLAGPANSASYIRLGGTSKFGLGTNSPTFRTEISGTQGNGYFGITNSSAGDILTINSSGRMGIGTSSPQATLDVNGSMRLKKNSSQPAACGSVNDASVAVTSQYTLCICKGSTTAWVRTTDGTTACSW